MNDEYTQQQIARIRRLTDDQLNHEIEQLNGQIEIEVSIRNAALEDGAFEAADNVEASLITMRQASKLLWQEWQRRLDREFPW